MVVILGCYPLEHLFVFIFSLYLQCNTGLYTQSLSNRKKLVSITKTFLDVFMNDNYNYSEFFYVILKVIQTV